jgi:hypothetical protein
MTQTYGQSNIELFDKKILNHEMKYVYFQPIDIKESDVIVDRRKKYRIWLYGYLQYGQSAKIELMILNHTF